MDGPLFVESARTNAGRLFEAADGEDVRSRARARVAHAVFMANLADLLPKGLYARALIIIIAPIVVLEGVIAFVFMERHWQNVTRRLSEATARDIAALIDIYEAEPDKSEHARIIQIARERLNLSMQILPPGDLPEARQKPFFDLLDRALSREISRFVGQAVLDRYRRASRGMSRSASRTTTPSCAFSPCARRRTPPTRTSSCCGWWARPSFC